MSEEVFAIKKFKSTIPWAYVINDLNGKEIIGTFYEKELQKTKAQGPQAAFFTHMQQKGTALGIGITCYTSPTH